MSNAADGEAASPDLTLFGPNGQPAATSQLGRHPSGRIPVLRHANDEIIETGAIVRFLDALQPDPP